MMSKERAEAIALVVGPNVLGQAVGWLEDCFEDLPADLHPFEVVWAVEYHYEGGWWAFMEAGA